MFGAIADTRGRRISLLISIIMMAVPTVLIGCLPTYAHAGIAAPILMALLRLVQGLAMGGEVRAALLARCCTHCSRLRCKRACVRAGVLASRAHFACISQSIAVWHSACVPPRDRPCVSQVAHRRRRLCLGHVGLRHGCRHRRHHGGHLLAE